MIKNHRWACLALLGCLGCGEARATDARAFQGIVEHEDRVLGLEVGGRVVELPVKRGDRVARGTVLVRLDDGLERPVRDARAAELRAATAQLRLLEAGARREEIRGVSAELTSARSQEEILRRNLTRQESLRTSGAIAPAQLDSLEAEISLVEGRRRSLEERLRAMRSGARSDEIDAATARVEAATAALAATDARLARYALTNLVPGTVVDTHVELGEIVAPGAPAVTVADLDHPYVDVFVPEAEIAKVRVGASARVRVDSLAQPLLGRVEHIFPETEFTPRFLFSEEERTNLVIRVRVRVGDPRHALRSGVPAFVTLGGVR